MNKGKNRSWRMAALTMAAAAALCLFFSQKAHAGVVEPSGYIGESSERPHLDRVNIQTELDKTGKVILEKGKTYYLRSTLHVGGNMTIEAEGATIICKAGAVRNFDYGGSNKFYGEINGLTIHGGTWKFVNSKGYDKSSFQFINGSNIRMSDMDIRCTGYNGHAIELIACKNVTIDNCNIPAQGKPQTNSVEEMIQMDVASKATCPTIYQYKPELIRGGTCKNVTISNCTIKGNRGICANKTPEFYNKFHDNIKILNCKVTGMSTEAVVLYNTRTVTVRNNTLICKSKKTTVNNNYLTGLHISVYGGGKLKNITIKNNKIKGYTQAVMIYSDKGTRYKKTTITGNKLYSNSKNDTMRLYAVGKASVKKNKNYKLK